MTIAHKTTDIVGFVAALALTVAQLSAISLLIRTDAGTVGPASLPVASPQVASQFTLPEVEVVASRTG